jgi:hypothetical protein
MSKPTQARDRRDGPPGGGADTSQLFSGLHLLVDAAMGVLEARRSTGRGGGGGNHLAASSTPLRD